VFASVFHLIADYYIVFHLVVVYNNLLVTLVNSGLADKTSTEPGLSFTYKDTNMLVFFLYSLTTVRALSYQSSITNSDIFLSKH